MANRPGFYKNGISKDIRTETDSSPITGSQTLTTITASAPFFSAADVGRVVKFSSGQRATITAFTSTTIVSASPSQTVGSTTFLLWGNTLGGDIGEAIVCNSNNIIVGLEQSINNADEHVFYLNTGTNVIRDLGFEAASTFVPYDLSEDGFVLLDSDPGFTGHRAKLYDPNLQSFTDLGLLPLGTQTTPAAMNASHVCAVTCEVNNPPIQEKATRWSGGVLTSVHPVADAGTEDSIAQFINSSGQIAGLFTDATSFVLRVFFNPSGGEGNSVDIGALQVDGEVDAADMNNSGVIVGTAELGPDFVPFQWSTGPGMTAIPLLPATTDGEATSINNNGWIVGTMSNIPFVYHDGVTHKLLDLITLAPEWTQLFTAQFINDNNQVVGTGLRSGVFKFYILSL